MIGVALIFGETLFVFGDNAPHSLAPHTEHDSLTIAASLSFVRVKDVSRLHKKTKK
jgi:hypothetical protein